MTRAARVSVLFLYGAYAAYGACAGCSKCDERPPSGASTASATTSTTAPTAPTTSASNAATTIGTAAPTSSLVESYPKLPCRALGVAGAITPPLATFVPREGWLTLAPGAKMTAKDPRTTRETSFAGPARVRACVGDEEESWLAPAASGDATFTSSSGAGEKPGAEEWVVTPFGVVRYASASVRVTLGRGGGDVRVNGGVAHVWEPEADAGPGGWRRIDGGGSFGFAPAKTPAQPLASAKSAMSRCETLAEAAHVLARAIAAPDASLADLAPRHVLARRAARAACAVARLRAETLPDDAPAASARSGLLHSAEVADATWRTVGE